MTATDGSTNPQDQLAAAAAAVEHIAELIAQGAEVMATHGNGPRWETCW